MSSLNFNLRGIKPEVMALLKREAKKLNVSVNSLIHDYIEKELGFSQKVKKTTYHDLDHLAGTWSAEDEKNFEKNSKYFEQIDEELWK
jgi:hypothetical protein